MKNLFSSLVIAVACALLVPGNGAEAVSPIHSSALPVPVAAAQPMPSAALPYEGALPAAPDHASYFGAPEPEVAWVLAMGFLALIVVRRIRPF